MKNDYLPFTVDRPAVDGLFSRLYAGIKFLSSQVGFHAGMILVMLLAMIPKLPLQGEPVTFELEQPSRFDKSLIVMAAFLPLILLGVMIAWTGVERPPEIGGSLVALSGLAMVMLLPSNIVVRAPRLVTSIWLLVLIGLPIGHVALTYAVASGSGGVPTQMWPARELSKAMQSIWNGKSFRRFDIVTGDTTQAGFVATYASPRPSAFIDADFRKSPWITPERLKTSGTLVLWSTADFPRTDELPGALSRAARRGGAVGDPRHAGAAARPRQVADLWLGRDAAAGAGALRRQSPLTRSKFTPSLRGATATKQSRLRARRDGLLRFARNDGDGTRVQTTAASNKKGRRNRRPFA